MQKKNLKYKKQIQLTKQKETENQPPDSDKKESKSFLNKIPFSEGILIAVATLLAYVTQFAVSVGFFRYFKIPLQFINLETANILITTFSLVSFTIISIQYGSELLLLLKIKDKYRFVGLVLSIVLLLCGLFLIWESPLWIKLFAIGITGILAFVLFGLPYFLKKVEIRRIYKIANEVSKEIQLLEEQAHALELESSKIISELENSSTISDDVIANHKTQLDIDTKALQKLKERVKMADTLANKLAEEEDWQKKERNSKGMRYFNFVAVLVLTIVYLSESIGKFNAMTQSSYLIANDSPECVVLSQSSEKAICFPFDRAKKEVEPFYKIIYFQDNKDLGYRVEDIGPLHPKPTPTPTLLPTLTPTVTPLPTQTPIPTFTPDPQQGLKSP